MNEYMKRYFTMNEHERLIYDCRKFKEEEKQKVIIEPSFTKELFDKAARVYMTNFFKYERTGGI